ncbi:pre-mRNA-processing factor 17-like [Bactrocera dorsalis]|uniref:Pre-mRNA-processing factor 17-like n=1 Tax=Bactrocera dorsalis TaxID=27457 RepID=A0ABM3J6R7_BACDO|nr:pre-mRNA-processing factor 17-like [Bactrocera dorsalis]XP_049304904.1 pre-mRNA-processing factor 17-like [Bactrocera dorsalis]
MLAIQKYSSSSESDSEADEATKKVITKAQTTDAVAHLKPIDPALSIAKSLAVCSAPEVVPMNAVDVSRTIDPTVKEVAYNPKFEELYAPVKGPENPNLTQQMRAPRNTLSGYVEKAHINAFEFENQRRTFHTYGYALDPSVDEVADGQGFVGDLQSAYNDDGKTVFESPKPKKKRKQDKNDNPEDIDGFVGPWGKYQDEQSIARPNDREKAELEEILAKRHRRNRIVEDKPLEEKSVLHIKDAYDYQGRSYLHAPHDLGINLRSTSAPNKCFLPKSHIHTWAGHTKGISSIRWFPQTAHLLLSGSMDCRVKLWEVFGERRCIRTFSGHRQAIKDIAWNNKGTKFLSASYDRYIKMWDAETGEVISRFTARKMPFCVKFHPDNNKQHLFVAGTSDKKIICWDTRSGDIVQEYDRHLGAVNTITFVDENRRFVTTSDDKSMRIWEWDIPVDMKYIADPTMHSMPAVTLAPNGKWLACQSLDNKIVIFSALNRFKMNRKKTFSGHMVSGYACQLDFSPDMSYLVSGDGDGKCYIWDWKTTKMYKKWQAHEGVCISAMWHPHEASKVVTAGWDGLIKYWD